VTYLGQPWGRRGSLGHPGAYVAGVTVRGGLGPTGPGGDGDLLATGLRGGLGQPTCRRGGLGQPWGLRSDQS